MFNWIHSDVFWSILLIIHGLLAVTLLGAITHQSLALFRNLQSAPQSLVKRFQSVRPEVYTRTICILWLVTFFMGGWIYAQYRITVRIPLEQQGYWWSQGFFEIKEHMVSIGTLLIPGYWALWKNLDKPAFDLTRKYTTALLAAICWFSFLVGHLLNNIRGFGS